MTYLLDTDSVSFALRGHGGVGDRLRSAAPSEIAISAITLAELRYGADRKASERLHRLIDAFAASVEVLPFDWLAALEYGRIGGWLAEQGKPIGAFDALIAAHAVSQDCTLVSNNERHFARVPGLKLESWTKPLADTP